MSPKPLYLLLLFSFLILTTTSQNLRTEWSPSPVSDRTALRSDDDVGGILAGFVIGPILFGFSFVIIWYNEKRAAINTVRLIKVKQLLAVPKQPQQISSQNLSQQLLQNSDPVNLIHLSGHITINTPAEDPVAKLTVPNALMIRRSVEVYQYRTVSNKKNHPPELGWYSYNMSEASGKQNDPSCWFLKNETFVAKDAMIEGYSMNEGQKKSLPTNTEITPTLEMIEAIKTSTNRPASQPYSEGAFIYFPTQPNQGISHGTLRLKYTAFKPEILSIIASHNAKNLQPFRIDLHENKGHPDTIACEGAACCCGCNALAHVLKPISQIDIVMQGKKTQEQMMDTTIMTHKALSNLLRVVAYFVMVFGVYLFFSPIVELLGYIPLVGGFLKGVTGIVVMLGALIVCLPLFFLTFSIAWMVYHPKIGIIFVLISAVLITVIVVLDQVYSG